MPVWFDPYSDRPDTCLSLGLSPPPGTPGGEALSRRYRLISWSHDCPVRAFLFCRRSKIDTAGKDDPMVKSKQTTPVVGGVDTHKAPHVAAVVDDYDQMLGTQNFATTRQC